MRLKELPMPDLDQIKQGKQGALKPAQAVSHGPVEQSRRPAARLPRRAVLIDYAGLFRRPKRHSFGCSCALNQP
jgi:hypothetical protein